MKNFFRITKDVYRSGHPTSRDYISTLSSLGIRSILDLCNQHADEIDPLRGAYYEAVVDRWMDQYLWYNYPMELGVCSPAIIRSALSAIDGLAKPVLIHCCRGVDRTGVIAAAIRVSECGWTVDDAIVERDSLGPLRLPTYTEALREWNAERTALPCHVI